MIHVSVTNKALVLLVSLSFALFVPILDFHGRLGATLGGLVAAVLDDCLPWAKTPNQRSMTVLAAKAKILHQSYAIHSNHSKIA